MPTAQDEYWEHFPHQADMGVRGIGRTIEGAFAQAAKSLVAVMTDLSAVQPLDPTPIVCESADQEFLFVDWLNALIFEMATNQKLFARFDLRIARNRLQGTAWGEKIDLARHKIAVEVKGATFTNLLVKQNPDGTWIAQTVVDV